MDSSNDEHQKKVLSSQYSWRRRPEAASPDTKELGVFFTSSLLGSFGISHNAAGVLHNTAMYFGQELEFLAGRCLPMFWSVVSGCPAFQATAAPGDGIITDGITSCLPPPLSHYDLLAKTPIQNVAEPGLISSFATGHLDVYLSWVSQPAGYRLC